MPRIVITALACADLAPGIGVAHAQDSARDTAVVVPKGAEEVWQLEVKRSSF